MSQSESFLSLNGSENFRNNLIKRNLVPYKISNVYSQYQGDKYFETVLSDLSPKNLPEISENLFKQSNLSTLLNSYGQANKVDAGEIIGNQGGSVSMQQAGVGSISFPSSEQAPNYTTSKAKLDVVSQLFINANAVVNRFSPKGGYDGFFITDNIIPRSNDSDREYPNYSLLEKNTEKNYLDEIKINKFKPLGNEWQTYTLSIITPKKGSINTQEYPNFSEDTNFNLEYQTAAAALNKFIPNDGYTYEVSLQLNVIPKSQQDTKEYSFPNQKTEEIFSKVKEKILINRYQPRGGVYNLYSNSINSLSKLDKGSEEYDLFSNQIEKKSLENQIKAASINTYSPEGGYTYLTELKLITTKKGQKGEYTLNEVSDDEIISKTKEKILNNKYKPTNGLYSIYSNSLFVPLEINNDNQYPNFSENTNYNSEYQTAAAALNKFTPSDGYTNEVSLRLNSLEKSKTNEYQNSQNKDQDLINKTKENSVINRYKPNNGSYNLYSNSLFTLPSNNKGEYSNNTKLSTETLELQQIAASSNRYKPSEGFNQEFLIKSILLSKNKTSETLYPNNIKREDQLIDETKKEISINRYTALNADLTVYSNNIKILPKLSKGAQEYLNSDLVYTSINETLQKEAAAINAFIPLGGYNHQVSLGLQTVKKEGNKGEYGEILTDPNLENFLEEIKINRYQPSKDLFYAYSNSLNSLQKIGSGSIQYPNFEIINNLSKDFLVSQTSSNKYFPLKGFGNQISINFISLPKGEDVSTEYPNISNNGDDFILENTKIETSVNRYSPLGGQLNIYSNVTNILPKIKGGSEEYVNSESINFKITKNEQKNAAAINKYAPQNGYNQELFLTINSISKGDSKFEYNIDTNFIPESTINSQNEAASVNKYIPESGYIFAYTNKENLLKKDENSTNEYPSNLKPDEEIVDETINKIAVNRYYPEAGTSYVYNVQSTLLNNNFYPTKEYPNFIIPNEGLLDNNLVDFQALLNGNVTSSINPQDSYLQQLSIKFLAQSFQERISREIQRQTTGRLNLQAFSDPFSLSLLATGQQPLIYKNYRITVPDGIFDQASDLIQRFSGTYLPVSPIEGEYFTVYPEKEKGGLGGLLQNVFSIFSKPATPTNRSNKFLNNTGSGQRNVLLTSLKYNTYRPNYDSNTTQVGQAIDNFFDAIGNPLGIGDNSIGNLYVPFDTEDIQNLSKPIGIDEIGKTFEGQDLDNYKFGLKSTSYDDDRDPSGGFSWTQQSTIDLAGKFVGIGGEQGPESSVYTGNVKDKFNAGRSDKISLRSNTLLKKTQEIIDDTPTSGAKRLTHVGNAINQVSKVFNDGYKEMTKGSRARKYVTKNGVEVGQEYGRVFTKDLPYLTYNNLQTTIANESGLETNGNIRKFTNSIVDSAYNLNIAPTFGQDSTNIKNGQVKKYMFSIENLAWRNTDEFNTLPDCEKGPNGGRIMWFPPYELKVGQENNSPTFNATNFLGRPEPIYTYENTKRSGSISWKIIVDHPSVMDIVLKYELNRTDGNTATQVVNSFFAGLKKYDIYELAKKYNTVSLTTLESLYQSLLQSNQTSDEVKQATLNSIGPESNSLPTNNSDTDFSANYVGYGFYFPVLYPALIDNYDDVYNLYYNNYKNNYVSQNNTSPPVINFFDSILNNSKTKMDDLRNKMSQSLENENTIVEITLQKIKPFGAPTNEGSWVQSIINYFIKHKLSNGKTIEEVYYNKTFTIKIDSEVITNTTPYSSSGAGLPVNCNNVEQTPLIDYSFNACACRGYIIKQTTITPKNDTEKNSEANEQSSPTPSAAQGIKPEPTINIGNDTTGISKRIIRELLTETNYFEVLKKDQSFVYDTIKTKFKFFNPAFHSMTPEGLNSRLVFLNQCVRPGKTIPVKQENGENIITDSYNTNFGSPPILVLRIGDFYNTKIVPNGLTFTYNDIWDFNPEGIGFQPMIVDVNLSFDMIGGHGLAGPVERLQNALSFNYYANTEIYDERAVPTEDTTAIDNALLSSIRNNEPLPVINNVGDVEEDLGKTFGDIVDSTPFSGGQQTGVIQYQKFFTEFVDLTRNYYQETFNVYETTVQEFNKNIWGQLMYKRNFSQGNCQTLQTPIPITLIGKPVEFQNTIQELGNEYNNRISEDRFYIYINDLFTANTINLITRNKLHKNFENYITSTLSSEFNSLSTSIQDISNVQLDLTTYMEKMDYISFSGDAKVLNDGSTKFYYLTGQADPQTSVNSLTQFKSDYLEVLKNITGFTYETKNLFLTFDSNLETGFFEPTGTTQFEYLDSYAFTLLSKTILDSSSRDKFVSAVVKDINSDYTEICTDLINLFLDTNWDVIFRNEKENESKSVNNFKNSPNYTTYSNYNPTVNGISLQSRERKMTFSTSGNSSSYNTPFNKIKSSQNSNNDSKVFNGKKQYNG